MHTSYCDTIVDRQKNSRSFIQSALKGNIPLKAYVGKDYKITQWKKQYSVCPVSI